MIATVALRTFTDEYQAGKRLLLTFGYRAFIGPVLVSGKLYVVFFKILQGENGIHD